MDNNFKQYEALLDSAVEAAEACLDKEGGAFLLAWSSELIRNLTVERYVRGANPAAQKLCESVCIDVPQNCAENTKKAETLVQRLDSSSKH